MQIEKDIRYFTVEDYDHRLILAAAELHVEHLSYHGFITLFGQRFIAELYKDILGDRSGFFIFAVSKEKVCGFVLGCVDSGRMFKLIIKKFPKYIKIIFPHIFRKPQIIPKLFETLVYVNKQQTDIKSELVVIVTDANYRAAGVGSNLVSHLNKEFWKRGVRAYKVTVHDEKERSNNFYLKNGMQFTTSFTMYGRKWNMYTNRLTG